MGNGLWRVVLYLLVVFTPLILITILYPETHHNFVYELGKVTALVGTMILVLQVLLAARIKWIVKAFGFDIVIRYHKYVAIFATLLIVAHPFLLAIGAANWAIIYSLEFPWYILVGKAALVILLANVILSAFQKKFKLKFETWRVFHDIFSPLLLVLVFFHSFFTGHDLEELAALQWLWIIGFGVAVLVFVYHKFIRPWKLSKNPYKVIDVTQEARDIWTLRVAPTNQGQVYDYEPGQFHFLTLKGNRNLPEEEHHFTISSTPTQREHLSSTIKNLGDFTSTIGETKVGDDVIVHGPFGRFSYTFRPEEKDLVFIIGGIGITPVISMLRHMRDTQADLRVLLLYGNKKQEDIVFRDELAEIENGEFPTLKVVHVLQEPEEDWQGETGFIDKEKIKHYCERRFDGRFFYVCGPSGLLEITLKNLRHMHVDNDQIHLEIFSFLD
jgi:predicted ferric reductase